jgi:hypothetical protein
MARRKLSDKAKKLVEFVSRQDFYDECERWYADHGPNKHEQEGDNNGVGIHGVGCVEMNWGLLSDWLCEKSDGNDEDAKFLSQFKGKVRLPHGNPTAPYDMYEVLDKLPSNEQRAVFNACHFHFGMMGFTDRDVRYFFS